MTRTLLYLITLAIYGSAFVYAVQAMDSPLARRAEHANLVGKMIRKRGQAHSAAIVRRQDDADTITPSASSATSASRSTATSSSTTERGGLLDDLLGGGGGGQQSSSTSSSSSSSTRQASQTSSSSSAASSNTSASESSRSRSSASTTSSGTSTRPPRQTVTNVVEETDSEGQSSNNDEDREKSFLSKGAMLGLGITAAVLVGAAALFTIIRKWKFSPSRHFEDRLEPITWEPTRDTGLPPVGVARGNSVTSHHGSDNQSTRDMSTTGAQPISMAPDFPPAHDFTAGPGHLAPNVGYNDLHRGPSPGPYQANANQYPNPYDGYDYNAGYGGARRY